MQTLKVNGKEYEWHHQYITGAEIKKIAEIDPQVDLYRLVQQPYSNELIADDSNVDLARAEIEEFLTKAKLRFTINKKGFETYNQFITGKEIRVLGKINEEDEIFLLVEPPNQPEFIKDETRVDLALPGKEHFVSIEKPFEGVLIVNGREKPWRERTISFSQVVTLAFGAYDNNPNKVYTVTYDRGPAQNPEGTMVKGDIVIVKNKMIFNVTATDKS